MGIYKKVVGGAREMQAVLTDSLVLDAVPRVNSMNFVTSDAVARAVAGASGEVPQVTEQDNGKVLKAIYDEGGPAVEWGDASPSLSAGTGINIDTDSQINVDVPVTNTPVSETAGHFDIGSEVPVKVNYKGTATGTTQQFVTASINTTLGAEQNWCLFDIADKDITLGTELTASLVIKERFKVPGRGQFGFAIGYAGDSYASNQGQFAAMTFSPAANQLEIEEDDTGVYIAPQTITLSGQNTYQEGYNKYIAFQIPSSNATLIAASFDAARAAGSIEIQHWPKTAATGYEVSIEPQKQANWWTSDPADPSYILHKPDIIQATQLDYSVGAVALYVWNSVIAAYRGTSHIYVKVPVTSMAARADGKAYLNGGYMKLPLVSVIQESSLHWTATFAATDGSYIYKAVLDNDEDEITWKPTVAELDE